MKTESAIAVAKQKGFDCFQDVHLVLRPGERRSLFMEGEMFVLTDRTETLTGIRVESTKGVYVRGIGINNEVQYEHTRYVHIENMTNEKRDLFFLEAKRQKR